VQSEGKEVLAFMFCKCYIINMKQTDKENMYNSDRIRIQFLKSCLSSATGEDLKEIEDEIKILQHKGKR